ncbi:NAD(P)H-binding protein [Streptomyces sp. MS1.AVA.3]|uniref:NmrA family NAD(P)-binding protein n=1 Tax=Streptomyces decoyicus TaxID=249567 RepID=UPI0030BC80A2
MPDHGTRPGHDTRAGQDNRAVHHTPTGHGTILVTGATGNTGSRLVRRLTALGHPVRAAARRAPELPGAQAVRFDWDDPATHDAALRGVARVYLVPPVGSPDPAAVMLPFLERARAAGVRRAVLLSSSGIPAGGPMVGQVHAALPGLFEEWAVLRPSWFMQNFTGRHLHAESIRTSGVIRSATGEGRVGFIDADDIAAVAVRALTDEPPPAHDLVLTGPQALSYDDIAATLTAVTGRPVHHRPLTYEQLRDRLAAGIPAEFAALLAGLDRAIADGAEDRVTDTVERLTGRPPRSFRAFAEEHGRAGGDSVPGS